MLLVCYSGKPRGRREAAGAAARRSASPWATCCSGAPTCTLQSLLDATQPKGRRYYWKSEYLPGIDARAAREAASSTPSASVAALGGDRVPARRGAIADLPADHSAVGNRDARPSSTSPASWEKPEDDAANVEWARSTWRDMKRFSTGGTYVNFLTEDEPEDRVAAAYGKNLERLSRIKASWDPQNVFRMNKNIAPAAS